MWSVTVYGVPAGKGSMKCVGRGGRHQLVEEDSTGRGKSWRALIKVAGEQLQAKAGEQLRAGPVSVEATLTIGRPNSVTPLQRPWPWRRSSGREHGGGDLDKMARLVLDGLQDSGLIADDSQVVHLTCWKSYPDTPGCPDRLDEPGALIRIWRTDHA